MPLRARVLASRFLRLHLATLLSVVEEVEDDEPDEPELDDAEPEPDSELEVVVDFAAEVTVPVAVE